MRRNHPRRARLGVAASAALALCACGGDIQQAEQERAADAPSEDCGELNLAVNPWAGYEANAYVVGQVAKTELGCDVEYKHLKEQSARSTASRGPGDPSPR